MIPGLFFLQGKESKGRQGPEKSDFYRVTTESKLIASYYGTGVQINSQARKEGVVDGEDGIKKESGLVKAGAGIPGVITPGAEAETQDGIMWTRGKIRNFISVPFQEIVVVSRPRGPGDIEGPGEDMALIPGREGGDEVLFRMQARDKIDLQGGAE